MRNKYQHLKYPVCSIIFLLGGCASTHDLSKGPGAFGGGVMHSEVKPGLFFVRSQTNWAPWPNLRSARSAWEAEATKACQQKPWKELNVREETRDTGLPNMGVLRYLVSEKQGYALCEGAETSEEALKAAM
ncbi:hypothetical protein [Variovorax terrae]|uniref:Lipoprotein n=1 Tax=Variovorax terrae TaxID=2923278 RepID=A0A9X1VU72_9BURK|nr:hypothetical protein [Variovorax terrae]MCJ0763333.1 hypothetical protein [Variovorax terrae]